MAERQIVTTFANGKWSASYDDRPEERVYGVTIQDAIERLKQTLPEAEKGIGSRGHERDPQLPGNGGSV